MKPFSLQLPPSRALWEWLEAQAYGRGSGHDSTGGFQLAALRIEGKRHDAVTVLVPHEHQASVGVDGKVPRRLALRRRVLHHTKLTRFGVRCEHGEAVVSPVADIEEASTRVYLNVRARGGRLVVGDSGQRLLHC